MHAFGVVNRSSSIHKSKVSCFNKAKLKCDKLHTIDFDIFLHSLSYTNVMDTKQLEKRSVLRSLVEEQSGKCFLLIIML